MCALFLPSNSFSSSIISQELKLTTTSLVVPLSALWHPQVAGPTLPAWDKTIYTLQREKDGVGWGLKKLGLFLWDRSSRLDCIPTSTPLLPPTLPFIRPPLTPILLTLVTCFLSAPFLDE